MARYLELCRDVLDQLHADPMLLERSSRSSQNASPKYEINERNEESPLASELELPGDHLASWAEGVARLASKPAPQNYPSDAWWQLIEDAQLFLAQWAEQAAALGWREWELFGVHRQAPWHRLDGRGLVPMLQGRELSALTDSTAVIRTDRGACLTYRRKPRDPLHAAEGCVVWKLG